MSELKIAIGGISMSVGIMFSLAALFIALTSIIFYVLTGGIDLSAIDLGLKLGVISLPFFAIHKWAWSE